MRKESLAVLAAVLTVLGFGSCSAPSAPVGNPGTAVLSAIPQQKDADRAAGLPAGGPGSPGGKLSKPPTEAGDYLVRTVYKDAPLPGVRVQWRHHVDDKVPAYSLETIRFGTATFRPLSGEYYLTAEWRQDDDYARPRRPGDRFAWYGGNPVLVSSEISETITLLLEEVPPLPRVPEKPGTGIFGRVTLEGVPLANVGVYAYATTASGFKSEDYQAAERTNAQGEFLLDLPPGRYYLLARLREDNTVGFGPLHKDDLLGYDPGNPVVVEKGRYAASAVPLTRLKMLKTREESSAFKPGKIEGRIIDRNGRPVPGVYAAVYEHAEMKGSRPVFLSEPTKQDGRFLLLVQVPGSYYLGARSGFGKMTSDTWSGVWEGSPDHVIAIKTGVTHTGVEIVVDQQSGTASVPPAR